MSMEGGREGGLKFTFQSSSLSSFSSTSAAALKVKYLQLPTTNVKLDVKHINHILHKKVTNMSSAPARRMSLMVSHQNHCNLGLDALH